MLDMFNMHKWGENIDEALSQPDPIRPDHYGGKDNPYEAIKVIQAWNLSFELGNVLKYINRAGKKDDLLTDLKKAQEYLQFEIEKHERQ